MYLSNLPAQIYFLECKLTIVNDHDHFESDSEHNGYHIRIMWKWGEKQPFCMFHVHMHVLHTLIIIFVENSYKTYVMKPICVANICTAGHFCKMFQVVNVWSIEVLLRPSSTVCISEECSVSKIDF